MVGLTNILDMVGIGPAAEERQITGLTRPQQRQSFGDNLLSGKQPVEDFNSFDGALSGFAHSQRSATRDELFSSPSLNLEPRVESFFSRIAPKFNEAIKVAENNPRNFGVLSVKIRSPQEANNILNNSIRNNFVRWLQAGRPGAFVDFFQQRWAPLGAENDPNGLNQNWVRSVVSSLKNQLSEEEFAILKSNGVL